MKELQIKQLKQKRELLEENHRQALKTYITNPTITTYNNVVTSLKMIASNESEILLLGGNPNDQTTRSFKS